MTRIAFFDLDGTLTDPKPGICGSVRYALTELGLPAPSLDELEWVIGPPMIESLRTLVGPERADQALLLYRRRYGDIGLFENRVYDGVPELLERLVTDGWRLYVATSKARPYALRIVEHFGLAPFFAEIFGSGLDGSLQHKDALLAHALAETGVHPQAATMIGDRKFDVLGARANGLPAIGVVWGYGSRAELEAAGAAAIVATPADVPGALEARKI
ncbi:MAG TPA: HAD hydrolase-like protein [Rhodoblastus sp.]|nr:HAD hydrolase-like protein [Rhodoblastus sp.]